MKKLLAIALTIIMTISLVGCGKESFEGKWVEDRENGSSIELFSDGTGVYTSAEDTGIFSGQQFSISSWVVEDGRFKITIDVPLFGSTISAYDYEFNGNNLILKDDNGEDSRFIRE